MKRGVYGGEWPVNHVEDNEEQEEWRKAFKRKLKTKAFIRVEADLYFEDIIFVDDDVDEDTIPLKTVLEEMVYHWTGRLKEPGWDGYDDIPAGHKRQYKKVANNFLKKYGDKEKVKKYAYINSLTDRIDSNVEIVDGKVLLK